MLRFIMFGMFASGLVVFSDNAPQKTTPQMISEVSNEQEIDPIITGISISDEHKLAWEKQNAKYKECGLCAIEEQPYPGD